MKPNEWACFNEHGEPEIPSLIPMQPGEKRKTKPRKPLKSRGSSETDMGLGGDRIWEPVSAFANDFPSGLSLIQHVNGELPKNVTIISVRREKWSNGYCV